MTPPPGGLPPPTKPRSKPRRTTCTLTGTDDGVEAFIRCVLSSPCCMAVVPMQDVLHLGSEARMNLPGTIGGNWAWRMKPGAATEDVARHLREMNQEYQRI